MAETVLADGLRAAFAELERVATALESYLHPDPKFDGGKSGLTVADPSV
jgi:hypothetical protein